MQKTYTRAATVVLALAAAAALSGCSQGEAFDSNQQRGIINTPTPKIGPGDLAPEPTATPG